MASYSDETAAKLREIIKKKNTKKSPFVSTSLPQPMEQKQAAAYCYGFYKEAKAHGLTGVETIELLKTTINR